MPIKLNINLGENDRKSNIYMLKQLFEQQKPHSKQYGYKKGKSTMWIYAMYININILCG